MRTGTIGAVIWCACIVTVQAASLLPPLPALPEVQGPIVGAISTPPSPLPPKAQTRPVPVEGTLAQAWAVDGRTVEVTLTDEAMTPVAADFVLWPTQTVTAVIPTDDPRVYRLQVDRLQPDTLYRVTYRDGEAVLFRTLRTARATSEQYKGRHGDYF